MKDTRKTNFRRVTDHMAEAIHNAELDYEVFTALIETGDGLQLFDNIKDPRKRPGSVIYPLKNILILTLLAIVSDGNGCPHSIHSHIETHKRRYFRLGLIPSLDKVPSHDVIEDLLSMVSPEEMTKCLIDSLYAFTSELAKELQNPYFPILQIDGKEMKGTGRGKKTKNPARNTNMVNLWEPMHGICLISEPADSKKNEIPKAQEILFKADLKKRFVTFDAIHTQEDTLDLIHFRKGWYVAPVKANQKTSLNHLQALFNDPKTARFIKKESRGQRDFEILRLSGKRVLEKFPHAVYAVKMVSRVHNDQEPLTMYFIANSHNVEKILDAIELRWDIENGLHGVKDSTLIGEDQFQCRNLTAQKNVAILNNFITAAVRIIQSMEKGMILPVAKKTLRYYPLESLKLVCGAVRDEDFKKLLKIGIRKETARKIGEGNFDWSSLQDK